MQLASQYT